MRRIAVVPGCAAFHATGKARGTMKELAGSGSGPPLPLAARGRHPLILSRFLPSVLVLVLLLGAGRRRGRLPSI
jgi:hypothetical protein